jgi:hypothetical protein
MGAVVRDRVRVRGWPGTFRVFATSYSLTHGFAPARVLGVTDELGRRREFLSRECEVVT